MLRQFYGDVLPEQGQFCLCLLPEGQHIWATDLDELTEATEHYADRTGVYFATAAFETQESRKQANVLSLRSLRLDIDAGAKKYERPGGPEKVYPTQRDALAAVIEFTKASGVVPTYIISSGEGLHLYYCLTQDLVPDAWLPIAKGLTALGATHSLKIDSSVTEDTARVLRPIGSLHQNGKRVSVLKYTGKFYEPEELKALLPQVARPVSRMTGINDDVIENTKYEGPPVSALKVAEHCGALREVAACKGDVEEPFWRAMIGIAKHCVEGEDLCHEWSTGYDGYDEIETGRKIAAWVKPPTTCTEFSKHTQACSSCKHNGKIKSPIALGMLTVPQIEALPEALQPAPTPEPKPTGHPWDGFIPKGYAVVRTKDGTGWMMEAQVKTESKSPTGEIVQGFISVNFTHDVWWFSQWARAEHNDDTAQVTVHLWRHGMVQDLLMDQSLIAKQDALLGWLGGKGISPTTDNRANKAMHDYAKSAIQRTKEMVNRPKVTDHLGLRTLPNGSLVACHGQYIINGDGSITTAMLGAQIRPIAMRFPIPLPETDLGQWGPEVWDSHVMPRAKQHADFLREYYGREGMERFQLAIMLGLCSPLMPFVTGDYQGGTELPKFSSLSVSLYSRETARGKTTACMAAVLAYGKPSDLANDQSSTSATQNGRLGQLSMHGTMPNVMDEMGGMTPKAIGEMVSAVGNGTGKITMNNKRVLQVEAPWCLVNLITTNKSQRDLILAANDSTGAVQARLLEIDVDNMPEYSIDDRDSFASAWAMINAECRGALGAVIHRELCALGIENCNKLVMACCTQAAKLLGASQSGRFQYRALGAAIALSRLLGRIGLMPFDMKVIAQQFKVAFDSGTEFSASNVMPTDGLELLNRALTEMAPNTIVTNTETHGGKNVSSFDVPLNDRVPDVVHGRHIKSRGVTYVSVQALRDWCSSHGVGVRELVQAGTTHGIIKLHTRANGKYTVNNSAEYVNLTKGMKSTMEMRTRCYVVSTKRLSIALGTSFEGEGDGTPVVRELTQETSSPGEPEGTFVAA